MWMIAAAAAAVLLLPPAANCTEQKLRATFSAPVLVGQKDQLRGVPIPTLLARAARLYARNGAAAREAPKETFELSHAVGRLDFFIIMMSWVSYGVQALEFEESTIKTSMLRSLRVLRILHSIQYFKSVRAILTSLQCSVEYRAYFGPLLTSTVVDCHSNRSR